MHQRKMLRKLLVRQLHMAGCYRTVHSALTQEAQQRERLEVQQSRILDHALRWRRGVGFDASNEQSQNGPSALRDEAAQVMEYETDEEHDDAVGQAPMHGSFSSSQRGSSLSRNPIALWVEHGNTAAAGPRTTAKLRVELSGTAGDMRHRHALCNVLDGQMYLWSRADDSGSDTCSGTSSEDDGAAIQVHRYGKGMFPPPHFDTEPLPKKRRRADLYVLNAFADTRAVLALTHCPERSSVPLTGWCVGLRGFLWRISLGPATLYSPLGNALQSVGMWASERQLTLGR